MDNGRMIKLMAMAYMFMRKLELNMKAIGRMICSMDQVQKSIKMETDMKACLNKGKEMVKESIIYSMGLYIKVSGLMVEFKVKEYVNGKMEEDIKVHGQIIRNMDLVYIHGQMEGDTKDSTKTIKSMEWGLILGQMEESMWANGRTIKDMEEANTS